jgi:hypothetical protein
MLGKKRKITIYLPKSYALWIEDYAKKNYFSLSGAVRDLLTHHIDRCLKPVKWPDPYTKELVPLNDEYLIRLKQYCEEPLMVEDQFSNGEVPLNEEYFRRVDQYWEDLERQRQDKLRQILDQLKQIQDTKRLIELALENAS